MGHFNCIMKIWQWTTEQNCLQQLSFLTWKIFFVKNSKNSFCNINILWNNLVWSTCIMNVVLMNCQRSFLIKFNCHMNYSPATTYIKLLSICFVSSDVLALAKLMNEQYTAAQAHHFNLKKISFTKLTKIVDYKASIGYWVFYMHPCCILWDCDYFYCKWINIILEYETFCPF